MVASIEPDWGTTPPRVVGIFGVGEETPAVLALCQSAGIRVAFVAADRPSWLHRGHLHAIRQEIASAGIPLLSEREFFQRAQDTSTLPLLLAGRVSTGTQREKDEDPYLGNSRRVLATCGRRLLHPVILAHLVPLPAYRARVALFGFPGSGNILAQHLLKDIVRCVETEPPLPLRWIAAFAEEYQKSTDALLRQLLESLGPVRFELIPMQFPTADLTVALPDGTHAVALHVPCTAHLSAFFYHTHGMPTRVAVDAFRQMNAPCVAVIRHPCENILSWASKLSRPPEPVLDDPDFFSATAIGLGEWHRQLLARAEQVVVLRYEDLVARRAAPLQGLAERLGVRLHADEVAALYDRYLHRDLLPQDHPGHYFRGGNDKWKKFFLPRHLQELRNRGYDKICARWDYDLSMPEAPATLQLRSKGGPSGQRAGVLPLENLRSLPEALRLQAPYPLIVTSRSGHITETIRAALHGDSFLRHLDAAGLGPNAPGWTPQIDWPALAPIFHPDVFQPDRAAA